MEATETTTTTKIEAPKKVNKFKIYDVDRGFFAFNATGYPTWVKKIEDAKVFNTYSEAVEMVLDPSEKIIRADGNAF